jgi:hypothetical protein
VVAIAQRPAELTSPRITADMVVWDSHQEIADFLAAEGQEGAVFRNGQGEWVRRKSRHDPNQKRLVNGVLQTRIVTYQQRVALTQQQAKAEGIDFLLPAPPGETVLGRRFVWMGNGVKPETDPGLYYLSQNSQGLPVEEEESWEAASSVDQARYRDEQERLAKSTPHTVVVDAEPAATGQKGK